VEATSFRELRSSHRSTDAKTQTRDQIRTMVNDVLANAQVIDIHTHLYPAAFGKIGLWGIDELLTYHYLAAEFFRYSKMTPELYWSLSEREQADVIWRELFVENTPISEATRGIVAILKAFRLPTNGDGLKEAREFFRDQEIEKHTSKVLQMAGVSTVVMTSSLRSGRLRPTSTRISP